MTKFGKLLASTILQDAVMAQRYEGKFGVEIEVEGQNLPQNVPGWVVHKEPSLRGAAAEYVTNGAVSRRGLEGCMELLEAQFKLNGAKPRDTYRAGIHIHYNMQKRNLLSIVQAVIRWTMVEPVFMKWMGKNRDGNLFCLPNYDCGDNALWFAKVCASRNLGIFFGNFTRGKYAGLNTDPLTKFGTLEGRCFPSVVNAEKILLWCDMVDAILGPTETTPLEEFDKANMNPEEFLKDIFGKLPVEFPTNAVSLVGFGLEQALPLVNIYEEELA